MIVILRAVRWDMQERAVFAATHNGPQLILVHVYGVWDKQWQTTAQMTIPLFRLFES